MARMMRDTRSRWILILPIFALVGFGCGPNAKDQKISELTAERDSLQDYLDDRDREIADARITDEDAQKTIRGMASGSVQTALNLAMLQDMLEHHAATPRFHYGNAANNTKDGEER